MVEDIFLTELIRSQLSAKEISEVSGPEDLAIYKNKRSKSLYNSKAKASEPVSRKLNMMREYKLSNSVFFPIDIYKRLLHGQTQKV